MANGRPGTAADVCATPVEKWEGAARNGICGHLASLHERSQFPTRPDLGRCSGDCGCTAFTQPPRELWDR